MLDELISLSREYGADPKWVVAGGGNTSLKTGEVLYVKASGFPLATIGEDGFARMDRRKLADIWDTKYPEGSDTASVAERERAVLADVMAARVAGETRRPSVETLLHDILPWTLIVHLHPTLVNGLTCGRKGEEIATELFGDNMVWIPYTDPGYVLAAAIKDALGERKAAGGKVPDYIFLANHGIFVGGADGAEIRKKYALLQKALEGRLSGSGTPGFSGLPGSSLPLESTLLQEPEEIGYPGRAVEKRRFGELTFGADAQTTWLCGGTLNGYIVDEQSAAALLGPLTPDHIVYAGPGAVFLGPDAIGISGIEAAMARSIENYRQRWGKAPNVLLVNDGKELKGALIAASGAKALANAVLLIRNALEVSAFAGSFGGCRLMDEQHVKFIVNWEAESYRSDVAS